MIAQSDVETRTTCKWLGKRKLLCGIYDSSKASLGGLRWSRPNQRGLRACIIDRIVVCAAYAGSMAGTLYAALSMHSYVLSLVFCGAQMVALLYYTLSYFPGGVHGLKYVLYSFKSAVTQCFLAVVGK
jgi:hypothetical protein